MRRAGVTSTGVTNNVAAHGPSSQAACEWQGGVWNFHLQTCSFPPHRRRSYLAGPPNASPALEAAKAVVESIAGGANASLYTDAERDLLTTTAAAFWTDSGSAAAPDQAALLPFVESAISCFNTFDHHIPPQASPDGQGGCHVADPIAACAAVNGTWSGGLCHITPTLPTVITEENACELLKGSWDIAKTPHCTLPDAPPTPPTDEATCKLWKGTWDASAQPPCALPVPPVDTAADEADCKKKGGTFDGQVCSVPSPAQPAVSTSNGLVVGAAVVAVAATIFYLTLNQKKGRP